MGVIKKNKIKTKVNSSSTVNPDIETNLANMSKLSIDKPVTGEMDLLVKKKNGVIVIDEYVISDKLDTNYKDLGKKIHAIVLADLEGVEDGRVAVVFETVAIVEES